MDVVTKIMYADDLRMAADGKKEQQQDTLRLIHVVRDLARNEEFSQIAVTKQMLQF